MKFTRLKKMAFCSFVLFGVIAFLPPWFVNFRAINPTYSALEVVALLIAGGVCLALCRRVDRERMKAKEGSSYEGNA